MRAATEDELERTNVQETGAIFLLLDDVILKDLVVQGPRASDCAGHFESGIMGI